MTQYKIQGKLGDGKSKYLYNIRLEIIYSVCRETRLCVRHTPGLGHVAAKGGEYRESQGSPGTATWPVF